MLSARSKPTWITVLDGAQARFFVLRKTDDGQIFEETGPHLTAQHERLARADRPRRASLSAVGGAKYALEARVDRYKLEVGAFSRDVANTLDAAFGERRYDRLVLVAPPRNLAELRAHLSPRVRGSIACELPKNLVKYAPDALWQKLSERLLKAAKPLSGGASHIVPSGGEFPVAIVFRNMDPSQTVQAAILKFTAKMGRMFGRIVSCRVTVDAPHHVHRKVKLYSVSVDLKLPGRNVAARSDSTPRRAYEDVNAALRDAFVSAMRQMQEYVGRMQGEAVRTKRRTSERERKLIAV